MDMDLVVKQRCEICGAVFIAEYGFSLCAAWLVTGYHQGVPQYGCPQQHWGCSPEHAIQALERCLKEDEISLEGLKKKHEQAAADGHPKVAPYFQSLYEEKGEGFHILKEGT